MDDSRSIRAIIDVCSKINLLHALVDFLCVSSRDDTGNLTRVLLVKVGEAAG